MDFPTRPNASTTTTRNYDLKAALHLQKRSNFNTETEQFWRDKNKIFSEINSNKENPPAFMSGSVLNTYLNGLERLLSKREVINQKCMEYYYKLDTLEHLYSKRQQENYDELSLVKDYKRFNHYKKLVDDLDFEWDWVNGEKKTIFEEFAEISSRLRGDELRDTEN
jgi:hypothetical protein